MRNKRTRNSRNIGIDKDGKEGGLEGGMVRKKIQLRLNDDELLLKKKEKNRMDISLTFNEL